MQTLARKSAVISVAPTEFASVDKRNLAVGLYGFLAGMAFALSAPGFDQWYLAWVGMVPLILLCTSSKNKKQAFFRGVTFGAGYHVVYLNWILGLHPMDWLHFHPAFSFFIATGALLGWSFHQALLVGVFALICHSIPLTGNWLPRRVDNKMHWPALIVIPTIWVLWMSKIGNAHCLLGVPWGMLEYSQYKQLFIIQIASIIGGIGIGFLIAVFNTSIASLIATLSSRPGLQAIALKSPDRAAIQVVSIISILIVVFAAGNCRALESNFPATQTVSILQGDFNFNIFQGMHKGAKSDHVPFLSMISHCPKGLCIGSENALPSDLSQDKSVFKFLNDTAQKRNLDLIFGCVHTEWKDLKYIDLARSCAGYSLYNAAFAIAANGKPLSEKYIKRYLVPISEYTPQFFQSAKELMNLPGQWQMPSLVSGKKPVVFNLSCGSVAPLICVECLSPELACASVREGGQLLVTLGDPSFLHDSMVGKQMIALNVLRAVENRRYMVFACNTGPSAIVNPLGHITLLSDQGKEQLLVGKVGFNSRLTPFCQWFSKLGRL